MRMRKMWMWTAALAFVAYGIPASGGMLYRWTAEDGSVAFADDAKRIPPRYRAAAQRIETSGITSYKRFSPTKAEGQRTYADQLDARVERLRALNQNLDEQSAGVGYGPYAATVSPGGSPGGSDAYVRVGRDLTVRVPQAGADEAPVIVDDVRVKRSGELATTHDTIVSQGGRVLLVVRGDPHLFDVSAREIVEEKDIIDRDQLIGE